MNLLIRNMVCNRCITAVEGAFKQAGLHPAAIHLGEVELPTDPTEEQLSLVSSQLKALGFEILDGKRQKVITQVKSLLIELVQGGEIEEHFSLSEFISLKLHKDYSQVSRLFSEVEGTTLEQYFILQKAEKVKEWLVYDELTLSEIAWKLGYSSVAHLSAQFKKLTGLTPTQFKKIGAAHRTPLDQVQKRK